MPTIDYTDQWGLAKPDEGATGYDTAKNADADSIDKKLGGGTFTNNTGGAIAACKAIYQTKGSDDDSEIDKAKADALATMPCIGFTVAEIAASATGYVQNRGILGGFTALDVGEIYYLSGNDAGEIQAIQPNPRRYTQMIGVARSGTELEIILGPIRKGRKDLIANRETLAGTRTLNTGSSQIQSFDPNGSSRDVMLPEMTISKGLFYFIANRGASGEDLLVKDYASVLIKTVSPGEMGVFACDGTEWLGGELS